MSKAGKVRILIYAGLVAVVTIDKKNPLNYIRQPEFLTS
jgi:hypothetical protein